MTIAISSKMYQLATNVSDEVAEQKMMETLSTGAAVEKFKEFITAQGGDASDVYRQTTKHEIAVKALPKMAM